MKKILLFLILMSSVFLIAQNQWTKQTTSFTNSIFFNKPKLKISDTRMAFIDQSWGLHYKPNTQSPWQGFSGLTQVDDAILTPTRFYILQGGVKYFTSGNNFTSINCPIAIDDWANLGEDIFVFNNYVMNNKTIYKYTFSTNTWTSKYKLQNCYDISNLITAGNRLYLIYRDTNINRVVETSKDGGNTWETTDLKNLYPYNIIKDGTNYF